MNESIQTIIQQAYNAFNARDIDAVLVYMCRDVHWPNGWEGGYVEGHAAVRDYWTRQWKEIDPSVMPLSFTQLADGRTLVDVQQTVKDLHGTLLFNGTVKHIYSFEGGLIKDMEIAKE
jgi:hypothetical protein